MATIGLKLVQLALIGSDGNIVKDATKGLDASGVYTPDQGLFTATTANITGLEAAATKVYGNNRVVDLQHAEGNASVSLIFNALPHDVLMKALGYTSDGKGGYVKGDKPKIALLITSDALGEDGQVYFGFRSGELIRTTLNHATNTATEARALDDLTYTPLDVEGWNSTPAKMYYSNETTFDKNAMMADVFPGYAATASSASSTTTGN
ncbi:phage tail protein [Oenococcus alcoholitolerans]|uniref:Phage tail protein n=1 Tax=Oenococcus alcoholitolerans TaxID=931074 RepID=A0ABR4XPI5_9LACO|nr:phage tail protein [Oenococcus alcoholitolerans]